MVQKWEPDNFVLQEDSVWSFPDRGEWATHKGDYRGKNELALLTMEQMVKYI